MSLKKLLLIVLSIQTYFTYSQNIKANIQFDQDTFSIGKICNATLSISHPDTIVVIFPQRKDIIAPFEWTGQEIFPTQTTNHLSKDAIQYHLQSFDLAPKQSLTLKYYYLKGKDTISAQVSSDSLSLQYRIMNTDSLQSLAFKSYSDLISIPEPPNTLLILLLSTAILAGTVILIFSLRKPIAAYFRRQLILREWSNIRRQLAKLRNQKIAQSVYLDELNKIWKDVFAKENYISLRSLTTPELIPFIQNQDNLSEEQKAMLIHTTRISDKVIYANIPVESNEIENISTGVHSVLETLFHQKLRT